MAGQHILTHVSHTRQRPWVKMTGLPGPRMTALVYTGLYKHAGSSWMYTPSSSVNNKPSRLILDRFCVQPSHRKKLNNPSTPWNRFLDILNKPIIFYEMGLQLLI